MSLFEFFISSILLLIVIFSARKYADSLTGPRRIRLFWLIFICVQFVFIYFGLNQEAFQLLLAKFFYNFDTTTPVILYLGIGSFIIFFASLLILLKNLQNDSKFIKILFFIIWISNIGILFSVNLKEFAVNKYIIKINSANFTDQFQNVKCTNKCNIQVIEKIGTIPWTINSNKVLSREIIITKVE